MAFLVGRECARVQGGVDAERAEEVRVAAEKPVALKCRGSGQGPAGEGRPGAAQVPAAGAGRARHARAGLGTPQHTCKGVADRAFCRGLFQHGGWSARCLVLTEENRAHTRRGKRRAVCAARPGPVRTLRPRRTGCARPSSRGLGPLLPGGRRGSLVGRVLRG